MGLTQGCYTTAHDVVHVPNISPADLEKKRQEEIEDPKERQRSGQTPQAFPKEEPKPEKMKNDGASESTPNGGISKKAKVDEPKAQKLDLDVGGEELTAGEAGNVAPVTSEKPQEAILQELFDDMDTQLRSIKELADLKRASTNEAARDVMSKLKENNSEYRIDTYVWIAEAVNLGLPIDSSIYQKLFEQYDIDQTGSLNMDQLKLMIREVAQAEVRLCDKALTSGELERNLEPHPLANVLLPRIRGQIEKKKQIAQSTSEEVDEITANEIRKKLDVNADGRVTKIEFMARIEETMWFEQRSNAIYQQHAGIGASEPAHANEFRPFLRGMHQNDIASSPLMIATDSSTAEIRA